MEAWERHGDNNFRRPATCGGTGAEEELLDWEYQPLDACGDVRKDKRAMDAMVLSAGQCGSLGLEPGMSLKRRLSEVGDWRLAGWQPVLSGTGHNLVATSMAYE